MVPENLAALQNEPLSAELFPKISVVLHDRPLSAEGRDAFWDAMRLAVDVRLVNDSPCRDRVST